MAISKDKKRELVADYEERLKHSRAIILTNPEGLNVNQISELRSRLRAVGTGYQVIKNTLLNLALLETELPNLDPLLEGPTAIGFCYQDAQPAAKVLVEFAGAGNTLNLKGGVLGQRVLAVEDIRRLAYLPSQEILMAQILTAFQSPIRGLVNVLSGPLRGLTTVLMARVDQMGSSEG